MDNKIISDFPPPTLSIWSLPPVPETLAGAPSTLSDAAVLPVYTELPTATVAYLEDSKISFRGRVSEIWSSVKEDYKAADSKQKTLILSAAVFQVWNQSQLQRVVSIPTAISVYKSTGNKWEAGGVFASLNYSQQFGISATAGAAARTFPTSLETFTDAFPSMQKGAHKLEDKKSGYFKKLLSQSAAGQGVGSTPYVMAEVIANPLGSTKDTVMNAEKVSHRIGIFSGLIGAGVLKLAEEFPTNDFVQRVVNDAQNPLAWIAVGAVLYVPNAAVAGSKAIKHHIKK